MPSVSSSDGGYQYYQRAVSEIDEELQAAAKRQRERSEEYEAKLEQNYRETLAARDRDTEETINRFKENSNEYVARDREASKAELERMRASTYDRNGRFLASDDSKRVAEDAHRAIESIEAKNRDQARRAEEQYIQSSERQERRHQEEIDKAIKAAREAAVASTGKLTEDGKTELSEVRKEMQHKYEELDRTRLEDLNLQRRRMDTALEHSQSEYEHRTKGVMEAAERKLVDREVQAASRSVKDAELLKQSNAEQTRVLRDQIKEVVAEDKRMGAKRAEAVVEAVQRIDEESKSRERLATEAFERETSNLKRQGKETEQYLDGLRKDALFEKDAHFSKLLENQNLESHKREKDLERVFLKDRKDMDQRMAQERQQASESMSSQLRNAEEARASALHSQAMAFQDTLARQRTSDREQIDALQKHLNENSTSSDTSLISPAAEAAVRKSMTGEYEKKLAAEHERNLRSAESIRQEYSTRLQETLAENESKASMAARHATSERNYDRAQYLDHVQEVESLKEASLRTRELDHQRETEAIHKNSANILERQRREYEDMIQTLRDDANARMLSQRQESEFASKMAQRAFSVRQNELIREYDKKLADQKQDYDSRLDDVKIQSQQALRENDRKNRQATEELQRSYEQRLSQMEAQHQERERYITQNYQDELEKMKRSNALLIQKKS